MAGEKHWTIHEPVLPDPLRTQPWTDRTADVAAAAEREPVIDAVLRPGDALYLPRGYLHSATALGEISAHLTIGVHSVTRWAAAESALDLVRTLAAEDPALRSSLPLGLDLADPDTVRDDVAAVIAGLQEWLGRVDPAEVADRLRAQTWAQVRPEPVAPLAQSAAAAALTDDTVLRLRRRLRCSLRDGTDGRVTLLAGRRSHSFPGEVRDALTALLAAGELKVGDLPGLDPADRLTLARRLITESVAVVPGAGPGSRARWTVGTGTAMSRADPVEGVTRPSRPVGRLDDSRCSVRALTRGDSPVATASPAQRWLLIEQPGPWGRDALAESRFDQAVAPRAGPAVPGGERAAAAGPAAR